jgi:uncharacterized protein
MHLTIIAKSPVAGRVKTRLVPPCTPEQAAAVAAAALADTIDAVDVAVGACGGRAVQRVLLLDGDVGDWTPASYRVVPQRGAGLAERLANGFADLGPGVVVGMDTPAGCRWLSRAVAAVAAGDDVLGLAADGGYWVIGLARPDPAVFADIPMSRSHTGMAQLRRLHAMGRPVRMLPVVRDLDDVEDLRAICSSEEPTRVRALARELMRASVCS